MTAILLVGAVACARPFPAVASRGAPGCRDDGPAVPCPSPFPPPGGAGPPSGAERARVVRTVDGDTLVLLLGGRRVRSRLIGLDAPETWLRHDCFGAEASRALRRLAPPGAVVRVAGDLESYDRYGRRLLYLWTARGHFVDEELVRGGFARAMPIPPNTRRAAMLRAAEAAAHCSGAGLWTACS